MEFKFDNQDNTFKSGTNNHGIGIYQDNNEWFGNLVINGNLTIGYGPYITLDQAKAELVKEFQLRENV